MHRPASAATLSDRLRPSPNFVLAFAMDGRPYVAKETEPYIQYWLTERYRLLLSMFAGRRGATIAEALRGARRLTPRGKRPTEPRRLLAAIQDMRDAGVLIGQGDDTSRYTARIVQAYVNHRPFPRALADAIIDLGAIGPATSVLDLAGGPGDLALALARVSRDVSVMDLSRSFLAAARARGRRAGTPLSTIHDSCNRLVYRDDQFDVLTISQALHWMDDVLVARGVCRVLRTGGSFFVIHSVVDLDDDHPLAPVLGSRSLLGPKTRRPFVDDVQPLLSRLTLLFEALDAPEVQRVDLSQPGRVVSPGRPPRIVPAGVSLFRQRRPFDMGYARAFLTDQHLASAGLDPAALWTDLQTRCLAAAPEALVGTQHWAILQFRRTAQRPPTPPLSSCPVVEIGYEGQGI